MHIVYIYCALFTLSVNDHFLVFFSLLCNFHKKDCALFPLAISNIMWYIIITERERKPLNHLKWLVTTECDRMEDFMNYKCVGYVNQFTAGKLLKEVSTPIWSKDDYEHRHLLNFTLDSVYQNPSYAKRSAYREWRSWLIEVAYEMTENFKEFSGVYAEYWINSYNCNTFTMGFRLYGYQNMHRVAIWDGLITKWNIYCWIPEVVDF